MGGQSYILEKIYHVMMRLDFGVTLESSTAGLILGLRPANERLSYFVTSLIGWTQAEN